MFEKGDRLVYGVNGVCTVEEMRSLEIAPGSSRDYYVLRPLNDPKTTLSVPVDSPLKEHLNAERYKVSDEELLKRLCGLK